MFHRKNATAAAPPPAPSKEPFFLEIKHYGYEMPVKQTLFTSFAYGGAIAALILLAAWLGAPIPEPFKVSISAGVFVFFVTVIITWPRFRRQWMAIVERVTDRDLNGDGVIGDTPAKSKESLWVMHSRNNGKEMSGDANPLPHRDLLPKLAAGILEEERDFSYRAFADSIPQVKFTDIQREFFAQGLARYNNGKNDRNGYALNREGVETLETILAQARKDQTAPLPYFPPR